jgi:hypothetical protein
MAPRKSIFSLTGWISKTAATLAALTLIGGSLWAAGDYTGIRPVMKNEFIKIQQSVDQTNLILLQLRFQVLRQKQQYGSLTFEEQQELCGVARALQYVNVPGC